MEVQLNGARIHYERAGAGGGFPVVLLHAGVADSRMWEPQMHAFAKHFDVIAPDMRGFGRSELPPGPWSPVEDVRALMDALHLKPAHLVGCSMGGSTAIDFALLHAERVSKIVVSGSGVSGLPPDEKYAGLWKEAEEAERTGDFEALNQADMHMWLDGPRRPRGFVKEPLRTLFLDMNGANMSADYKASPMEGIEPPAAGRLHEITAPTLVVVGDEDLPPVFDTVEVLMEKLPHARKAVIRDAAHLPNLEHPDEFNRLVLEFLLT